MRQTSIIYKGKANRMSGHHPFGNLTKGFSPEQRRRVDSIKARLLEDARFRQAPRDDAPEDAAERKPEDDSSERGIG